MLKLSAAKKLRILDFDIENRPLSYLGSDFTTADVTSIAASFVGSDHVYVWLLGVDEPEEILTGFTGLFDQADIVTGHYIRKHDLPLINAALMEFDLGKLEPKLVSDTKLDLIVTKGLSLSQESLAAMYRLDAQKVHMTQPDWRRANRLTPEGVELTRKRVVGDIIQHKQLRTELVRRGLLKRPTEWRPWK